MKAFFTLQKLPDFFFFFSVFKLESSSTLTLHGQHSPRTSVYVEYMIGERIGTKVVGKVDIFLTLKHRTKI